MAKHLTESPIDSRSQRRLERLAKRMIDPRVCVDQHPNGAGYFLILSPYEEPHYIGKSAEQARVSIRNYSHPHRI